MQSFNPELKVGMPAMVIGVLHPQNSHLIGKMVVVEALFSIGEIMPESYCSDSWIASGRKYNPFKKNVAIVEGCHINPAMKEPFALFDQKNLMPLPPLDDDAIIFANEEEKELVKC